MRISEYNAREIAENVIHNSVMHWLSQALGRPLNEGEGRDLHTLITSSIAEVLADFTFDDAEQKAPEIDHFQVWADDHAGQGFKRPKGQVVYTVTGEVGRHQHGLIVGISGVMVKRSSDDREIPMTIKELESMQKVEETENA